MEMVRNVIHYDAEALEKRSQEAMALYEDDPEVKRLRAEERKAWKGSLACKIATLVVVLLFLCYAVLGDGDVLMSGIACIVLYVAIVVLDVVYFLGKREACDQALYEVFCGYNPPSIRYHDMVKDVNLLAVYGRVENETEFETHVIVGIGDSLVSEKIIYFLYDAANTDGVLTLDIADETVRFLSGE